jgi:CheY-like chemotaxis protein
VLAGMLKDRGYKVRPAPSGKLALLAAHRDPPDLILLDINMPEMNGYEVCQQLKSSALLAGIPVIFLSALDAVEDKVKGFRSGGVDYVPKPFQFEEVQARVETHLKLRRAQQAEHDLLEKTLGGAVGTLWELVQLTSPLLALRSRAVRDIVRRITRRIGTSYAWQSEPWQYELAATLCLVGCVALPDEVFERAYCGEELSPDEDRMFRAHPQTAARLLSNIPRLEVVVEIIRGQQEPETEPFALEQSKQGAQVLHLALQLDRRIYRGVTSSAALAEFRLSRRFEGRMLDALDGYSPAPAEFELRRLPIRELRAGMVLEGDFFGNGNLLVLKKGTILTETWIERLENFSKARDAQELIDVFVPILTGAGSLAEFGYGVSGTRGS